MTAHVQFAEVSKSYDGRTLAVAGLSLSVRHGEFLSLLGPSGSGKTTSLMMLAGFEAVTGGEIRIDGRPVQNIPPHRRGIGVVFQNYALFGHMSVAENVGFALKVRGRPKPEIAAAVGRALAMVRMDGFEARLPAQLSGGQQQRVAVARALVFGPQLVLMDEPLGALDKQLREEMQLELKHLHAALGVTIVYVTHDQGEALTMSDRIAVFRNGRIEQLDTPQGLYERPQTAFVAGFIGENNQLRGRVLEVAGEGCRVALAEGVVVPVDARPPGPAGSAVTLAVRPEHVLVEPEDGTAAVAGQVIEVIYHGDHLRCRARFGDGGTLVAKLPNGPSAARLVPGAPVTLGWLPGHCRILADA